MKSKLYKRMENKFLITLMSTIFVLFTVFFTSKIWMYDDNPILQTPFNVSISGLSQTEIILNNLEYNPEKELMEVTIQYKHDGTDLVVPSYSFLAKDRESMDELKTEIVYQDERNIVVQIKEIPTKYKVIGLFIKEIRDENILIKEAKARLTDDDTNLPDGEDKVRLTLASPKEKVITGDYRKIKENLDLGTKSELDYQVDNINLEISNIEKEIDTLVEEDIPEKYEVISSIEKEIETIKEGMEFETEDEKHTSNGTILAKENSIIRVIEEQRLMETDVEKLKEKRTMLVKKRDHIIGKPENDTGDEESLKSE